MISDSVKSQLKEVDPDRVRAAMFAEDAAREDLLTLYAFHAELAKVPEMVSEPMIGQIRYQWWRDAVGELFGGGAVRAHEISTLLAEMLSRRTLSRFHLDKLIDGRERDLDPTPFETLDAAQDYCRSTSGVLMRLAASILGEDIDLESAEAAGTAWGLTGLARGYGYYHTSMLRELSFEQICAAADAAYRSARDRLGSHSAYIPATGYAALIPKYLARMTKSGFDPTQEKVGFPVLLKQFRLMGAVIKGRI